MVRECTLSKKLKKNNCQRENYRAEMELKLLDRGQKIPMAGYTRRELKLRNVPFG